MTNHSKIQVAVISGLALALSLSACGGISEIDAEREEAGLFDCSTDAQCAKKYGEDYTCRPVWTHSSSSTWKEKLGKKLGLQDRRCQKRTDWEVACDSQNDCKGSTSCQATPFYPLAESVCLYPQKPEHCGDNSQCAADSYCRFVCFDGETCDHEEPRGYCAELGGGTLIIDGYPSTKVSVKLFIHEKLERWKGWYGHWLPYRELWTDAQSRLRLERMPIGYFEVHVNDKPVKRTVVWTGGGKPILPFPMDWTTK